MELTAADRLEIKALFARWAIHEDSGDSEAWASLFTDDGSTAGGSGRTVTGRGALIESSRERWAKPEAPDCRHWMGEPVITPTEEGARARHYAMVLQEVPGGYATRSVSERTYELRRERGHWRIHSRSIEYPPLDGSLPGA